jgi:hypothetical protein
MAKYGVGDVVEYTPPRFFGGPVIGIVTNAWEGVDSWFYAVRVTDGSTDFPTGSRLNVAGDRLA